MERAGLEVPEITWFFPKTGSIYETLTCWLNWGEGEITHEEPAKVLENHLNIHIFACFCPNRTIEAKRNGGKEDKIVMTEQLVIVVDYMNNCCAVLKLFCRIEIQGYLGTYGEFIPELTTSA